MICPSCKKPIAGTPYFSGAGGYECRTCNKIRDGYDILTLRLRSEDRAKLERLKRATGATYSRILLAALWAIEEENPRALADFDREDRRKHNKGRHGRVK
jgi:hypothetical protein